MQIFQKNYTCVKIYVQLKIDLNVLMSSFERVVEQIIKIFAYCQDKLDRFVHIVHGYSDVCGCRSYVLMFIISCVVFIKALSNSMESLQSCI